jgi:hypothetical protein
MTQSIREQSIAFFLEHAGYSYDPATETPEQGKLRSAQALADAESWAAEYGAVFQWDVDDGFDSSTFSDANPPWELWVCLMYMPCADCPDAIDTEERIKRCTRKVSYHMRQVLGGIDFGRNESPWGRPYQRVVEAELALEAMP